LAGFDGSEELDFFTSHHIGSAVADKGNSRDNRLAFARPQKPFGKILDCDRTPNIRCFHPALVRSDHPGKEKWIVAESASNLE
jgi:hypothetical protein